MMYFLLLGLGVLGGLGCLFFGGSLLLDLLSAAQFRAEGRQSWDLMKSECKRSTKGTLKLFLICLAVTIGSILLASAISP